VGYIIIPCLEKGVKGKGVLLFPMKEKEREPKDRPFQKKKGSKVVEES
jgi:hypothetical protein